MRPTVYAYPSGTMQETVNEISAEFEGEMAVMQVTADGEAIKIAIRRDLKYEELARLVVNLDTVVNVRAIGYTFAL